MVKGKKYHIADNLGSGFCLIQALFTLIFRCITKMPEKGKPLPIVFFPKNKGWKPCQNTVELNLHTRVSVFTDETGVDFD